jgi:hypothetical protein
MLLLAVSFSCSASLTNSLSVWLRSAALDLTLRKRTSGISIVVFTVPILPYLREPAIQVGVPGPERADHCSDQADSRARSTAWSRSRTLSLDRMLET